MATLIVFLYFFLLNELLKNSEMWEPFFIHLFIYFFKSSDALIDISAVATVDKRRILAHACP